MKVRMYSMYDKKTKIYHPPIFCHNAGHAMRCFKGVFFDRNTMMARFPVDYDIYDIGEFDDSTASIESEKPTFICTLESLDNINPPLSEVQNAGSNGKPEPSEA